MTFPLVTSETSGPVVMRSGGQQGAAKTRGLIQNLSANTKVKAKKKKNNRRLKYAKLSVHEVSGFMRSL